MAFLIGGANTLDDGGYTIDNSLRMNDADNAYLSFTPGSDGDLDKWTLSMWVKRTTISTYDYTFTVKDDSDNNTVIVFYADDGIRFEHYDGSQLGMLITNKKIRDPSAWYHVVFVWDTSNATAGNRQRMYINGVEQTSFATDTNPSSGRVSFVSDASYLHWIGRGQTQSEANNFDGHLAEVAFCDGQAYAASDFGETNDNGVWVPKKLGVTFGSQGYYLEFKETGTSANASGIGADTSGNGNHWAVTNLAATDITTDTPTNNFCTMNPLHNQHADSTFSEGNLQVATTTAAYSSNTGTMGVSSGKWYYECKNVGAGASNQHRFGFDAQMATGNNQSPGLLNPSIGLKFEGNYALNGSNVTDSNYTATSVGDIVGVAIDVDNNKFWARNSSGYFEGDPAAGSGGISISAPTANNGIGFYLPSYGDQHDGEGGFIAGFNFGNPFFAISSGNADENGYGNFEFAVPSGFYALCTKNLAEFG